MSIPKWLTDSIYANRQFKAGDAELSIQQGQLAWRFDVDAITEFPFSAHRVEFLFSADHQSNIYEFKGKFLIPGWCDFTLGGAVIMQWHGPDSSGDNVTLRIHNDELIIYAGRSSSQDEIARVPLVRDKWIEFKGSYSWLIPGSNGYCFFKGSLDGTEFDYSGLLYRDMYQKYGCYRVGHLEGHYPAVHVWWTGCEKEQIYEQETA